MSFEIPDNLEALRAANSKPNPVNIAGYGRESTHKGYLSWILSTLRNKSAVELVLSLGGDLSQAWDPNNLSYAKCEFEQRIGRRKVDLQVRLCESADTEPQYLLPIELKTDSGPSGKKQFQDMSSHISADEKYLGGLVFCLGSSSVQDHKWGRFKVLGPDTLLDRWLPYYEAGPDFFRDWIDMLAVEIGRKRHAPEIHRHRRSKFRDYGYRNYKHLMYYVYANFRDYLQAKNDSRVWTIYDGGYNAVMNLKAGPQSWRDVPGFDSVRWFFEFNDDRLCLKLEQNSQSTEAISTWANKCIDALSTVQGEHPIRIKSRRTWKKGWPLLGDWNVDFSDFAKLEAKVNDIIDAYGVKGIMGDM